MKSHTIGVPQRSSRQRHTKGEGPNWILIAGGALLSTLSIQLGCKLKQLLETKRAANISDPVKGRESSNTKRSSGVCPLHHNLYCFTHEEDCCYHCASGVSNGTGDVKRASINSLPKESNLGLPLVTIPPPEQNRENGIIWASSPDCLDIPRKPFHHSNGSNSPSLSESGSDMFTKREVIHKLRQQLKRRDDMILEMQAQITELQNSLSSQISQNAQTQSQLDLANQELFDSGREIQHLRKVIVDHCIGDIGSPDRDIAGKDWQVEARSSVANGFVNGTNDSNVQAQVVDKGREGERIDMLKTEIGELKEVIEGKEFLLQSYKEQKTELCTKVKELQLKLASQVPNIL